MTHVKVIHTKEMILICEDYSIANSDYGTSVLKQGLNTWNFKID